MSDDGTKFNVLRVRGCSVFPLNLSTNRKLCSVFLSTNRELCSVFLSTNRELCSVFLSTNRELCSVFLYTNRELCSVFLYTNRKLSTIKFQSFPLSFSLIFLKCIICLLLERCVSLKFGACFVLPN